MTRSREPDLPERRRLTDGSNIGKARNTWLRSNISNNSGRVYYKSTDVLSITKASDKSWNIAVTLHIFPLVDWYDARVAVGAKNSADGYFESQTNQHAPGNPDFGSRFRIVPELRYYLKGAIEYWNTKGE